jgi:hypothetical protein
MVGKSASQEAAPILVLGETRRRDLETRLGKCISAWWGGWSAIAKTEFSFSLAPMGRDFSAITTANGKFAIAKVGGTPSLCALLTDAGAGAALGLPRAATIGCMEGSLAGDVCGRMISALAKDVLLAAQYQETRIEVELCASADVALVDMRRWWQVDMHDGLTLWLAPQVIGLLSPLGTAVSGALEKRRAAISDAKICLQAVVGHAEISVGELSSLRVNDVIVLSASLSEPAALRNSSGRQVASASPGRVEGKRAVVITKV